MNGSEHAASKAAVAHILNVDALTDLDLGNLLWNTGVYAVRTAGGPVQAIHHFRTLLNQLAASHPGR